MTQVNWDEILETARTKTDAEFASKLSSLTALTDKEILEIAPTGTDREKLAQLISIVNDATISNERKAQAISSIRGGIEILLPLIEKVVKAAL